MTESTEKNLFFYDMSLGKIAIAEKDGFITHISLLEFNPDGYKICETAAIKNAYNQLLEYLNGERKIFNIPFKFELGTEFQQSVWNALCKIPYGQTMAYSEIASEIGRPKAVRAVGAAAGKNPLMIVVPCHRMVGKDKGMTGFACGIEVKKKLLDIESKYL